MASFTSTTHFSCCACRVLFERKMLSFESTLKNVSKTERLQFKRILENVLEQLVYHIDPKTAETWFNHEDNDAFAPDYTDREENMEWSLIVLLKNRYDSDPDNKADSIEGEVDLPHDVCPALKRNLKKIVENHKKIAENPFEILSGKASYQRLVVDLLHFTAKFLSQCIDKFDSEKYEIFDSVIETVEEYFHETYIIEWIKHDIQRTEPFGIAPEVYERPEKPTGSVEKKSDGEDKTKKRRISM